MPHHDDRPRLRRAWQLLLATSLLIQSSYSLFVNFRGGESYFWAAFGTLCGLGLLGVVIAEWRRSHDQHP